MKLLPRRHFLTLLPAAVVAGCNENRPAPGPRFPKVKWRITSTTHFTADLVRQIGGDAVESRCFLADGVSPHGFVPAGPDISKLHTSDIIFTHGLGLESKWPADFEELAAGGVAVFSATALIPPERVLHPSGPGGPADPHVWMHPELAGLMVNTVEAALKEMAVKEKLPRLAEYFTPRAQKLRVGFENVMKTGTAKFKELPAARRLVFTSHDTMQYFAVAFGLETRALTTADGQIPDKLPEALREWIAGHGLKSLFRESFTDVLALRRMLEVVKVNPDHVIYSLTLPPSGTTALVSFKSYNVAHAFEGAGLTKLSETAAFLSKVLAFNRSRRAM